MDILDAIYVKRSGGELSQQQIDFLCRSVSSNSVDREQVAALLMAIYIHGMSIAEMKNLTLSMARSGDFLEQGSFGKFVVDKHSTGGVGDKVTLILIPLLAEAGLSIAKMSGRGLGHTGGTLDKLEVFDGFRHDLTHQAFRDQVRNHGVAITGQTEQFVPADKYLYALRDLTGTVESLPLIASSIMSKKIGCGADAILLDVKVGSGATLGDLEEARTLAQLMISIGKELGRNTEAVLTAMDEPLGNTVGNLLEVKEAIETLQGQGPADLVEVCLVLGSRMLKMAGACTEEEGRSRLMEILANGSALAKLRKVVNLQGGSTDLIDRQDFPQAEHSMDFDAIQRGYLHRLDARTIGHASMLAGAGRRTKKDIIDPLAGIVLHHKVGDQVPMGASILTIYGSDPSRVQLAYDFVGSGIEIASDPCAKIDLVIEA